MEFRIQYSDRLERLHNVNHLVCNEPVSKCLATLTSMADTRSEAARWP